MQLSGFGNPDILLTILAGLPPNSFIRYRLVPFLPPNSCFTKFVKALVAGEI